MSIRIHLLPVLALILVCHSGRGQGSVWGIGTLPSVNLNKSINSEYALNFRTELRQSIEDNARNPNDKPSFEHLLSDHSIIASRLIGLNGRIALGYLLRFRDQDLIQRWIQQYTLVQRLNGYRLAHRLAADQTLTKGDDVEYRVRYRITPEFSLNGRSVNSGEWYLKINNEYLLGMQAGSFDCEFRLVPLFGYLFNDNNKLEFGIDQRLGLKNGEDPIWNSWLSVNWFLKI